MIKFWLNCSDEFKCHHKSAFINIFVSRTLAANIYEFHKAVALKNEEQWEEKFVIKYIV